MDWFITWIHNTEASRRKKADDVRNDADLLLPGGVDPWKHKENRGFESLQSDWKKKKKMLPRGRLRWLDWYFSGFA